MKLFLIMITGLILLAEEAPLTTALTHVSLEKAPEGAQAIDTVGW